MWKYIGTKECNDFLLSLQLLKCKDNKKYIKTIYSISNNIENNYRIYKIKKKNGGLRTIYEPKTILKQIQKRILENILKYKSISKYATAYYPGTSIKNNALPHVNKEKILKLDIQNFFENISFLEVYHSCFSIEYFPKSLGMLLTHLCTYHNCLVQGSPTAPYISNLVMKDFDEEIGAWCNSRQVSYTRYSDDLTFSGDFNPSLVIAKVQKELNKKGFKLNKQKTHIISKSSSQNVTGVVVNQIAQVSSQYRKKIRQEIYYIEKFGLASHLKECKIDIPPKKYINILYGKVLYVLQINKEDKEFIEYKKRIIKMRKQ